VYLARVLRTGGEKVVKVFTKNRSDWKVEDIRAEFDLLKTLDHPNIQKNFDLFCDDESVFVISAACQGGDLNVLVDNAAHHGVHITNVYLARVMHQVFAGVVYIHNKCIMHCDLKETNMMIQEVAAWHDPTIVLIDFGLARNFVVNGNPGGTPGYAPPEVWTRGLWTPRGDVHSLGVVMFQMFSGETCYHGQPSTTALCASTCHAQPNFASVDEFDELRHLLTWMLDKDFHNRPSARDAAVQLLQVLIHPNSCGQQAAQMWWMQSLWYHFRTCWQASTRTK